MRLFLGKEGDLFLDVGAHAGRWTIPLARTFRKVVALEPNPYSAQALSENVESHGLENVAVWNVGATYEPGMRFLTELDWTPSRSTLYPEHSGLRATRGFWSYFVKLDEWFTGASFLKIDAEGSEYDILKGAQGLLTEETRFCIETHSDRLLGECAALLRSIGADFQTVTLDEDAPGSLHARSHEKHRYLVRA